MSLTATYYRGHDLLTVMPNAHEDRDEGEQIVSDVMDGGVGQVSIARAWAGPVLSRPWVFTLTTRSDINDFLWWCALRRGSYSPLWVPTWRRDFQLTAAVGSSATDLIVESTGYSADQFGDEARQHLAVIVSGGGTRTVYPRRITAAVDNLDGTETITLESTVGVALDLHVVLSFLVLSRLDSDDIPLEWSHLGLAESRVRFVELPRQVAT